MIASGPSVRLELKGISEPVQAFELEWEPAPLDRHRAAGAAARAAGDRLCRAGGASASGSADAVGSRRVEGSLRLALIGGEAGVGKTRLSTHLALDVHGEGATVLYGRCDEDLGVPYQPWVAGARPPRQGGAADDPRCPCRALRRRPRAPRSRPARSRARSPSPRESDPETERYLLYAAVAGLLERAGEEEPLLLILDDLHWADPPTLSLLRHVVDRRRLDAGDGRGRPTATPSSRSDHPLTALLADLHREQGVERMKLTGLDAEDVLALMEAAAGQELDEDGRALAAEITRETAGNPFFAGELLRHLTESGAIVQERWALAPGGRSRRSGPAPERARGDRAARRATRARRRARRSARPRSSAVTSTSICCSRWSSSPRRGCSTCSMRAVAASLLQENTERAGRFTFTHALVEHALYEDLGATRRARLHRQVAEALEEQCGDEPGERLGELAGHWAAAVVSTDTAKAIHYARLAAERALEQLAPDEAVRWYRQALELHDQAPGGDGSRALRAVDRPRRGRSARSAAPSFARRCSTPAELAQELGDSDRLCRAVLANTRGLSSQIGAVDSERVEALEAAAAGLPDDDPRRAQVLALLASELH